MLVRLGASAAGARDAQQDQARPRLSAIPGCLKEAPRRGAGTLPDTDTIRMSWAALQLQFLTWTEGGFLRGVWYQGQREDKPPRQVVRFVPYPQ